MKIMVVQLGRIGDMILLTPMFSALKKKYPNCRIDVLASRHNYSVLQDNPNVDNTIIYEKSPLGVPTSLLKIIMKKYDYWLDPKDHHSTESNVFAKLARANVKIGYSQNGQSGPFDKLIPASSENGDLHFSERAFNVLQTLDIPVPKNCPSPELFDNKESSEYVESFLEKNQIKNYFVLNISASNDNKMWDTASWKLFLDNIKPFARDIVVCCAPSEIERARDLKLSFRELFVFNSRSMNDVISLIKKSSLLMSPDTSLVHVAAAFNIPLLGLYSGLDDFFAKFYAVCSIKQIVRADKGDGGIKSIKVKDVIDAYNEMLVRIIYNQ